MAAATSSAVSSAVPAGVRPAASTAAAPPHGIIGTLRRVVIKDGLVGLYRGIYPTLAGVLPYAGTNFFMYVRRCAGNDRRVKNGVRRGVSGLTTSHPAAAQANAD